VLHIYIYIYIYIYDISNLRVNSFPQVEGVAHLPQLLGSLPDNT